jgi:flagellum-specific peptidoglycan hydrolase FlgJ
MRHNNYFGVTGVMGRSRVYASKEQSFYHHTDLLLHHRAYRPLRNLSKSDYISWAHGLQRCGYATDKQYARKLIIIINRYNLPRY